MYLQANWNLTCTFIENPGSDILHELNVVGFSTVCSMPSFPPVITLVTVSFLSSPSTNVVLPIENWVKHSANLAVVTKLLYYLSPLLCEARWLIASMVRWPHELCFNNSENSNWQVSFYICQFMFSHRYLKVLRLIPSLLVHSVLFPDTLLSKVICPVRFSCQISSLFSPPLK